MEEMGVNPWSRKIPWRREWQPTLVFLPAESPWTEERVGATVLGGKESDTWHVRREAVRISSSPCWGPRFHPWSVRQNPTCWVRWPNQPSSPHHRPPPPTHTQNGTGQTSFPWVKVTFYHPVSKPRRSTVPIGCPRQTRGQAERTQLKPLGVRACHSPSHPTKVSLLSCNGD